MLDKAVKTRDKRVKPRFKIEVHAKIKAQLIGSSNRYAFITENISESGLLVTYPEGSRHSFNSHSILEVWVANDRNEPIYFFAKFVRKAGDLAFAIKIIDIDSINAKKYQEFIDAHRDSVIIDESSDMDASDYDEGS